MSRTTRTTVGIDVGFGDTKVATQRHTHIIPTIIGPAVDVAYKSDLNGMSYEGDMVLEVSGDRLFVGDLARRQSPHPRSPIGRERDLEYVKHMVYTALYAANVNGHVDLVTGLPVIWFSDADSLAAHLQGCHTYAVNRSPQDVDINVHVIPQPFGAIFNRMIDRNGRLTDQDNLARKTVAVVDVGAGTSDFAVSAELEYIEKLSGSIDVAMSAVYEQLQRVLLKDPYRMALDIRAVEKACRRGWLNIAGVKTDISTIIDASAKPVAKLVTDWMTTRWGNGRQFAKIIMTGGGAHILGEHIRNVYPQIRPVSQNSQTANVFGFWKLAMLQSRQ